MAEALQEFVDSSAATLRVDRRQGVLRGVKLIGLMSRNGRKYKPEALIEAKSLYEGAKVNVNHPKGGPLSPRDYQDRLGVIREVAFRAGEGLFGDLHFNPKHPLAEQLVWDAEHNPRNVGVSHNVMARVSKEGEQTLVEAITHVQSVDLVADPAATQGLYEHSEEGAFWKTLTVETLKEHRADLCAEISQNAQASIQQQLDEARAEQVLLERRNHVLQLLCEHGLALEVKAGPAQPTESAPNHAVSSAFYEMLVGTEDAALVEELLSERAELVRAVVDSAPDRQRGRPSCRDQIALQATTNSVPRSSEEFARALRVVSA